MPGRRAGCKCADGGWPLLDLSQARRLAELALTTVRVGPALKRHQLLRGGSVCRVPASDRHSAIQVC